MRNKPVAVLLEASGVLVGSWAGFTVSRFFGLMILAAGMLAFGLASER